MALKLTPVYTTTPEDFELRDNGWYFTSPYLELAKHHVRRETAVRITAYYFPKDGRQRYSVALAYGSHFESESDLAEEGVSDSLDEAWRYALGAYLGSAADTFDPVTLCVSNNSYVS